MKQHVPIPAGAPLAGSGRRYWIQLSDLNWWVILLLYTVAAIISADTVYTSELAKRKPIPFLYPLLWELTGYYAAFALLPLVVFGFSRLPIRRTNCSWAIPAHLAISLAFGVTHTLLMLLSRRYIYGAAGLGAYDYGEMGYRFVMEYHKQFLHYWAIYAVLWGLAHYRQNRERERQAAALQLKTAELERQLAQVQLQALRSQLNPHFLFNTLNMVSSVMYDDVDRADHMIAALSQMLRMSLQENVGARVPLRRELDFVHCAIELIEARFQEQVSIQIQCPPAALDEPVPNLLVHTLLENAIKHHGRERDSVMRVQVRIERDEATLHIHVLDNGPGIEDLGKALRNGLGLTNTRQRLQALYGDHHRFDIVNRPEGGLHVHVALPLQLKEAAQPVLV